MTQSIPERSTHECHHEASFDQLQPVLVRDTMSLEAYWSSPSSQHGKSIRRRARGVGQPALGYYIGTPEK